MTTIKLLFEANNIYTLFFFGDMSVTADLMFKLTGYLHPLKDTSDPRLLRNEKYLLLFNSLYHATLSLLDDVYIVIDNNNNSILKEDCLESLLESHFTIMETILGQVKSENNEIANLTIHSEAIDHAEFMLSAIKGFRDTREKKHLVNKNKYKVDLSIMYQIIASASQQINFSYHLNAKLTRQQKSIPILRLDSVDDPIINLTFLTLDAAKKRLESEPFHYKVFFRIYDYIRNHCSDKFIHYFSNNYATEVKHLKLGIAELETKYTSLIEQSLARGK
jgi:hypothetical protein